MKEPKLGWPFDYGTDNVWLFLVIVCFGTPIIMVVIAVILKGLAS